MLVIGTFPVRDARFGDREKVEFDQVRWMEIGSVLQELSDNGSKPVERFPFTGERLDMTSIYRWRKKVLGDI